MKGKWVCYIHGGKSPGAPKGNSNAYKHGAYTKEMNELVKRYDITVPDDPPYFNEDDEVVDKVFEAAVDYLAERGIYCITNGRIINFTREEVFEAIAEIKL